MAKGGICGLIDPIGQGITPGSGPAHMALFGYDPFKFIIGRGVLEAVGIDLDLKEGDVAARGNFCTVDDKGLITDRRAGRISTERCDELCQLLSQIKLADAQLFVPPVKEHRFVVVFRGKDLSDELNDSDPQQTGVLPKEVAALSPQAKRTAEIVGDFVAKAKVVLAGHQPANMLLLRGFSQRPHFPQMSQVYKLKPAAIAVYPMYRGLAKLVGMEILETGTSIEEEFATLSRWYNDYDFFFLHIKQADSAGEDGDFERKVKVIEEVDAFIPHLVSLKPEVIVVTGDHSTPAVLKSHSWHSVPFLLFSPWCRRDDVTEFSEITCAKGALGRFPTLDVMPLAMANALKFTKFGA